ncbi:MAG: hypothetical protein KJO26_12065, partial [Deltaproteobacteria bacterium]|nr:hypothetical protein [Deltaproteobacteria bacterium]
MAGKTLIFGNGICAEYIAQQLTDRGTEIIIATQKKSLDFDLSSTFRGKKDKTAEMLTGVRLVSCNGVDGNFDLLFADNGKKISRTAETIILAEKEERKPDFALYGVLPSTNVISLSELTQTLTSGIAKKKFSRVKKIVLLTGLFKESNPVIANEVMQASLRLQVELRIQTYIMAKNLKVASSGMEALFHETKKNGVIYIKFTDAAPNIHQGKDGVLCIEFADELTLKQFRLTPD